MYDFMVVVGQHENPELIWNEDSRSKVQLVVSDMTTEYDDPLCVHASVVAVLRLMSKLLDLLAVSVFCFLFLCPFFSVAHAGADSSPNSRPTPPYAGRYATPLFSP